MSALFEEIDFISELLDSLLEPIMSRTFVDHVRVSKLQEEAGEAYTALLNMQGLNPRKGVTGTEAKLREELADVAITALGALQHFTSSQTETERIVTERAIFVASRLEATP